MCLAKRQSSDHPLLACSHYSLSFTNPTYSASREDASWVGSGLISVSLFLVSTCLSLKARGLLQWRHWLLLIWTFTGKLTEWSKTKTVGQRDICLGLCDFSGLLFSTELLILSHHIKLVKRAVPCASWKVLFHFLTQCDSISLIIFCEPPMSFLHFTHTDNLTLTRVGTQLLQISRFVAVHHNDVSIVGPSGSSAACSWKCQEHVRRCLRAQNQFGIELKDCPGRHEPHSGQVLTI